MIEKYRAHKEATGDFSRFIFDLENEEIVKDFESWVVIRNKFPYDGVTRTHHMLVPKRYFATPREMNAEERRELEEIKLSFGEEYDGLFENLSHKRSVPSHFHIHLFSWKHRDS